MPLLMCPNCNSSMNEIKRGEVAFDMCPACRGVWLDRGELEKIIEAVNVEHAQRSTAWSGPAPGAPPPPQQPSPWEARRRYEEERRYEDRDDDRGRYRRDDDDERGGRRRRGFDIFDIFD